MAYPPPSSLLSSDSPASLGPHAGHTRPTSLQHGTQYAAPQAGEGHSCSRGGVSFSPHTVQLRRNQRRNRGQRRQQRSTSADPCGANGDGGRSEREKGREGIG